MDKVFDRFRLDGKVAVITGVGPANSSSFALALAEAGADVCLVARSNKTSGPLAERIRAMGRRALVVETDLLVPDNIAAMIAKAHAELGRIDILFNHVGGLMGAKPTPLLDLSDADWRHVMNGNIDTMFYCTRAAARIMVEQGTGGSIVNTSSATSLTLTAGLSHYSVSKAAVNQFTRAAAAELAPHGIRVNCLLLGAFGNNPAVMASVGDDFTSQWLAKTLMHRLGHTDESASAALFLASEASSFVTGAVLPVSGGIGIFGN